MKSKSQINATNKYDKENYFRKLILIPKDYEQVIKDRAEQEGKSINKYIIDLIFNDLEQ